MIQSMPLSGIINKNRVFKTRHFDRWMRKTELTDVALCAAVREMSQDLASELLIRSSDELAIAVVDEALKEICHEH
jgi:RelE toxin of RelE / RelB toxin-antitoxin system